MVHLNSKSHALTRRLRRRSGPQRSTRSRMAADPGKTCSGQWPEGFGIRTLGPMEPPDREKFRMNRWELCNMISVRSTISGTLRASSSPV